MRSRKSAFLQWNHIYYLKHNFKLVGLMGRKALKKLQLRSDFLKKPLLIMLMVFLLLFGFITLRFGSALGQEGNPIPILTSIIKLELTNSVYQQFSETNNGYRYVSKTTRNSSSGYDSIKEFMKEKGWSFKGQMGAGFVFEGDEETVVIETRLYSKHYFLWYIPKKVLN